MVPALAKYHWLFYKKKCAHVTCHLCGFIGSFYFCLKTHSQSETIFGHWKPFKNDEKCFLLFKLYSFSKDLYLCLNSLVMQKNGLIRKIQLYSKFMTSQPGKQIIIINILPNIVRRKGNQTIKLGLLIDYNLRNIFFEKSYTKCGYSQKRLIPDPFLKNQNGAYFWINSRKFYKVCL